jgi:type II secretory pathway pseudopilin PulG
VPILSLLADTKNVRVSVKLRRGTTLAELLVAVAFAGAAVASILATAVYASKLSRTSQERAIALSMAQETIETARKEARSALLVPGTQDTVYTKDGLVYIITAADVIPVLAPLVVNTGIDGDVTVTRDVQPVPGTTGLYKVTATATWPSHDGGSVGRTKMILETYMRSPGD